MTLSSPLWQKHYDVCWGGGVGVEGGEWKSSVLFFGNDPQLLIPSLHSTSSFCISFFHNPHNKIIVLSRNLILDLAIGHGIIKVLKQACTPIPSQRISLPFVALTFHVWSKLLPPNPHLYTELYHWIQPATIKSLPFYS